MQGIKKKFAPRESHTLKIYLKGRVAGKEMEKGRRGINSYNSQDRVMLTQRTETPSRSSTCMVGCINRELQGSYIRSRATRTQTGASMWDASIISGG